MGGCYLRRVADIVGRIKHQGRFFVIRESTDGFVDCLYESNDFHRAKGFFADTVAGMDFFDHDATEDSTDD